MINQLLEQAEEYLIHAHDHKAPIRDFCFDVEIAQLGRHSRAEAGRCQNCKRRVRFIAKSRGGTAL